MHILFMDETNKEPQDAVPFFIYGGLVIEASRLGELSDSIAKARVTNGYQATDDLKFDTNARPKHVPVEKSRDAKLSVIDACRKCGCKFIAYIMLHDIMKSRKEYKIEYGADHVVGQYNYLLRSEPDDGICIIDNLPEHLEFRYLKTRFCHGLTIKGEDSYLDRVRLFASSCIGASHLSSAADIVLGSFRYCVNQPKNEEAAAVMLTRVTPMMWRTGIILRPKLETIRVARYRVMYEELINRLNSLLDKGKEIDA